VRDFVSKPPYPSAGNSRYQNNDTAGYEEEDAYGDEYAEGALETVAEEGNDSVGGGCKSCISL
jgi:hypothetical protein